MANTTTRSPVSFGSLPAELRNEIYHYTLVEETPIQLPYAYENTPFHEPPLLATSAWIRAEAAPIYYGSNTFSAPSPPAAHFFLCKNTAETISLIKTFRPIDLVLPWSAHKRWTDALVWNLNRLVKKNLCPEAVEVPLRGEEGDLEWCRLADIEGLEVVWQGEGFWSVQWKDEEED
ncbi:hypothetical protein M409DRAFT_23779 [Zasmidium cellare ATCC 36951]|uniref:Uncharacterized protein n=1 Tax=Zasmidium cellare ATCC 36951 TaxID=1080233 RepID=A0A6A6CG62_ZASCE|nr:uncharacterized protein M409DRAFT_23779 [Zasmidium cellare ATCC 36951]KAF2166051.1 hypothetical protein M409DRAFT_23779 [Zasmidium cellare ATCC 36951]